MGYIISKHSDERDWKERRKFGGCKHIERFVAFDCRSTRVESTIQDERAQASANSFNAVTSHNVNINILQQRSSVSELTGSHGEGNAYCNRTSGKIDWQSNHAITHCELALCLPEAVVYSRNTRLIVMHCRCSIPSQYYNKKYNIVRID